MVLGRSLARPIRELSKGAEKFSQGDLDYHIPVSSNDEIGEMQEALNRVLPGKNE